jgi:hypothetical protein
MTTDFCADVGTAFDAAKRQIKRYPGIWSWFTTQGVALAENRGETGDAVTLTAAIGGVVIASLQFVASAKPTLAEMTRDILLWMAHMPDRARASYGRPGAEWPNSLPPMFASVTAS